MSIQLLVEELSPSECNLISESSPDGKNVWLAGVFMQADIKNRNGRVYPLHEISTAIREAEVRIKEQRGIMGELDHPQTLTINLDRVSHIITELRLDGTNGMGRAKLLSTPMGNIAKELSNSGVAFGMSTRGAGSVDPSGNVSGFQFVTVDIVAQPSAPSAYPSTVYESLQLARNGHNIMDLAEAVKYDPAAQKYLKTEILKWIKTGLFAKR